MANNTFEAAYMKLKNGMTLFFQDSGARDLIKKLQTAVSLIHGIPAGGTTAQVLKKASNDDFDVEWANDDSGDAKTIWYATCPTAAGTAAKVAASATGDFVLATGNMVRVLFSDTNIQTQPTLSVDGSTAKRIKNITTDNNITTNLWRAGEVVDLVYDGTDFIVSDGGLASGTYYGRTKLSNSTSSASQTTAASSKAVKDTYDAIPAASNATPQDLGTAAAGSSTDYSRADHVHNKPTYSKSDVGLGNVDNVQQYSASNPPPYPVTSVNGHTGAVSVSERVLLWTNPTPSTLAAGAHNFSMSGYSQVEIECTRTGSTSGTYFVRSGIGTSSSAVTVDLTTIRLDTTKSGFNAITLMTRMADVYSTGIVFSSGQMIYDGTYYKDWDNRAIPYRVWGIKW